MRIEKREMIFLSQKEADIWTKFSQILEGIERESENPYILDIISEITGHMSDLWEEVEDIEWIMYTRIAVLTKKEWKEFLKNNPIPEEYSKTRDYKGRIIYTIYSFNSNKRTWQVLFIFFIYFRCHTSKSIFDI